MQGLGGIQPHPAAKGFNKVLNLSLSLSRARSRSLAFSLIGLLTCLSALAVGVDQAAATCCTAVIRCHLSLYPRNDISALEVVGRANSQHCRQARHDCHNPTECPYSGHNLVCVCVCVCVCLHMPLTEQVVAEIHVPTAPGTLVKEENMLDKVAEAEGHSTIIAKGSGTHRFFATTLGAN